MIYRHLPRRFGLLVFGLCVMLLNAGAALSQEQLPEVVGEVTTAIGQGVIRNHGGDRPTVRGERIHAGDRIETADGGHVHIRFVDGGLVSVRPLSRLLVEEYRSAKGQSLAAIKFRLEDGVIRSVTGQWGEANRDRFRLNTPIAAIGVKGTDFVVKVEQGKTFASVLSGAIVMAPLEGGCVASLGPCQTERSAFLSAEMQGQMLEYMQKNGGGAPQLVPSVDLLARNGAALPQNELRRGESVVTAKVGTNDPLVGEALESKVPSPSETEPGTSPSPSPQSKPLAWLHNAAGWNVPANSISEKYSAELAAGRAAVVGNFFINLYRDETVLSTFQPQVSSASFSLTSASASFAQPIASGRPVEAVQIANATLDVDFARSTFATQMQLSSASLGQTQFQAGGGITPQGIFTASGNNQSLGGAFSMDGRQAGYFFEKTVVNGKVSGLTLWGK